MKTLKLAIFSLAMMLMLFTSCTNNESVLEDQQTTEESESITNALLQLRTQFDDSGNVTQTDNPAGNIVLDFCFDFVYPLNLSYNNGTTVTINNLDDIITVILNSTDELYINGIAFPFNVETYNDETNAIEIVTINDENEFLALLDSCDFNVVEPCECFEIYDPVCVTITDPTGNIFTVTYSNACYAACDGFTENDFVANCVDDYYTVGGDCFTLNYPLSIIINDETTVVVNSEEELGNVLYDVYSFDFVYPLDVTIVDGDTITIYNEQDFEAILMDCYGCICTAEAIPVCVEIELGNGDTETITFSNACEAECQGFTQEDFVDCDDNTNPSDCSEDVIQGVFAQCAVWQTTVSNILFTYLFDSNDNTLEIYNDVGNIVASGTWEITIDSATGNVVMILNTNSLNFTTVWFFINCDGEGNFEIITNGGATINISSTCD